MSTLLAKSKAMQIYNKPKTKGKIIDVELFEAIVEVIDEILSEPWLGNATTEQLLNEIKARIEMDGRLNYKTADWLEPEDK